MASSVCGTCLRSALRQRASLSRPLRTAPKFATRALSSTPRRFVQAADFSPTSLSQFKEAAQSSSPGTAKADVNKIQGGTFETYAAYGATEILYKECSDQAPYSIPKVKDGEEIPVLENGTQLGVGEGWWYTELGLKPTFTSWTQITMLHMYLVSARLRCFEPEVFKTWQQHFTDHFFTDAENRMTVYHGIDSRSARNGYLKDLFLQWRGVLLAYDEGIIKGDAVLAAAIWRNLFNADEDVDFKRLAEVVAFMRSSLQSLESMGDVQLAAGHWVFAKPTDQAAIVEKRSRLLDLPLDQAPGKPVGEEKA